MKLLDVLLVLFVVLKLVGAVTWSWWLILTPLWIILALYTLIFWAKAVAKNARRQ